MAPLFFAIFDRLNYRAVSIVQFLVVLCACWISHTTADYYNPQYYDPYTKTPIYYSYNWEVKDYPSGNDYRHEETRKEDLTTGQYQVLLPGGRHQTVNYRVNKGSGFMADVSYQGDANYFSFKQKYRDNVESNYSPTYSAQQPTTYTKPETYPQQSYPKVYPQPEPYTNPQSYPEQYPKQEAYEPAEKKYPSSQAYPETYSKPLEYPRPAKPSYQSPSRSYEDPSYSKSAQYIPTPAPVDDESTTEKAQPTSMDAMSGYTVPMYPLYRADYYSAKVKSGKSIQQSSGGYALDEAGEAYIKPAAMYYVPERLGVGYDVDHRKGTMRRPAKSDYEAPERLTQL